MREDNTNKKASNLFDKYHNTMGKDLVTFNKRT